MPVHSFVFFCFLGIIGIFPFNPSLSFAAGTGPGTTGTTAHREIRDASQYPYSAIGTVNWAGFSSRSSCTGTLIAENIVVTAAHCIFNAKTGHFVKPAQIHFAAGFQKEKYLAHTTAKEIYMDPNYRMEASLEMIEKDWAILVLKDPIGRQTGYMGWAFFSPENLKKIINPKGKVMVAGYPRDRHYVLSTEYKCKLSMAPDNNLTLRHNCKVVEGDSGGPVAILYKSHATLIAINTAANNNNKSFATTLFPATKILAQLLNGAKEITRKQAIQFTKGAKPTPIKNTISENQ